MKIPSAELLKGLVSSEDHVGSRLNLRVAESGNGLITACKESGLDHWIVMYSGGKDSTAALLIALEAAKVCDVKEFHIVFGDTNVEIPTLAEHAERFLASLPSQKFPLFKHTVSPADDETFWVLTVGKGYPPPHQRFRWCTSKLKIKPAEVIIKSVAAPNKTAIITGVRFGESDVRDHRLKLSCSRGGECGQGLWFERAPRIGAVYLGPIVAWRECDVWDYLEFVAPTLGYDTSKLKPLYLGPKTRFGCWTCTVVKQDKTMQKIVNAQPESGLQHLLELRNWLQEFGKQKDNRVLRGNGVAGRLSLSARKQIFDRVKEAESASGRTIMSSKEIEKINLAWKDSRYGDSY
jgi:DNA sulfur modification protein DndC